MNRQRIISAMLLVAVLCLQSCSGGKTNKKVEQNKSAPAVASITVKQRTPAELLAALPCKLDNKQGVFAVFPDNPGAGQICFSLSPSQGNNGNITTFDIQGGGMHIIFHDTAGSEPVGMKLMRWEERDARPCLEAACGKEIPVKREIHSAPENPGWTYIIVTPEKPIDFASSHDGYYGLVIGADKSLPLFQ